LSTKPRRSGVGAALAAVILLSLLGAACEATPAAPTRPLAAISIAPTPTRRPTPPPTPSPADAAIEAFVELVTADDFSYVASIDGRSRHSADILPVDGSLSVAGADSRLVATFVFPEAGGEAAIDVRVVRGTTWYRETGFEWEQLGELTDEEAPNPFALLEDVADVTLVEELDGDPPRYRVEIESMVIHPGLIPAGNLSNEAVDRTELLVVIDAAGRPIEAGWTLRGKGRVSSQLQEIVIELALRFSRLGERITISRP
jgi:hypothetical protein